MEKLQALVLPDVNHPSGFKVCLADFQGVLQEASPVDEALETAHSMKKERNGEASNPGPRSKDPANTTPKRDLADVANLNNSSISENAHWCTLLQQTPNPKNKMKNHNTPTRQHQLTVMPKHTHQLPRRPLIRPHKHKFTNRNLKLFRRRTSQTPAQFVLGQTNQRSQRRGRVKSLLKLGDGRSGIFSPGVGTGGEGLGKNKIFKSVIWIFKNFLIEIKL